MSGEVPDGWRTVTLRDHMELVPGFAFKSDDFSNDPVDRLPLIRIRDLTSQEPVVYVPRAVEARYLVRRGDFLVGMDGEFQAVRWSAADAALNQRVLKFFSSSPHLDSEFLFYRLQPELARLEQVISATTVKHLSTKHLHGLEIPLPPLAEQRCIAEILSSVDEAIQATQAVIEQTRKVKDGVLQRLLTKGIGHTHFKVSDAGLLPQSWKVVRIAEVATAKGGKRMPKGRPFASEPTPYPYIRVSDLKNGTISSSNLMYVLPEDQKEIKNYTIASNDVYISIAGTIGLSGTIPPELDGAQLTENAAKLVIKNQRELDHEFLARLMQSETIQRQIVSAKGIGGGVPKLALFRIEQMFIPLPPIDEQIEILKFARVIDAEIESQENILSRVLSIKSALVSDLLTGRRRVSASLPLAAE